MGKSIIENIEISKASILTVASSSLRHANNIELNNPKFLTLQNFRYLQLNLTKLLTCNYGFT
jgi:hypothetical protein